MGTNIISGFSTDITFMNTENQKNEDFSADFKKTLDETLNKDINVVDELKTSSDEAVNEYKKENSKSQDVKSKVENNVEENNQITDSSKTEEATDEVKDEVTESEDDVQSEDETDVVMYEEAMATLINAYSSVLDIPKEQIVSFIEENNITVNDLTDPAFVQSFVMDLEGIEDSAEILTDPTLFENIKELQNITKETAVQFPDLTVPENKIEEVFAKPVEIKAEDETEIKITDDFSEENVEISDIKTEIKSNQTDNDNSRKEKDFNDESRMNNNTAYNTQVSNDFSNVTDSIPEKSTFDYGVNAQEIYDQIGDYIKNLSTEALKEVELQLQPETLGTIQVRVSQHAGVTTAEMVTSNDNVKAVLESQLIQLKQDFENSGIKVESIEVKVSTNAFNENTENDSRDDAENEARRAASSVVRRFNIGDFSGLDDIDAMDDEEKIVAEMMTANGNSLDYKA